MTDLSRLKTVDHLWETAQDYQQTCHSLAEDQFLQVTDFLLENPNLNSTNLFRADILLDSAQVLKTVSEKESQCHISYAPSTYSEAVNEKGYHVSPESAPELLGAILERKVLRKLIPRNPQLDRPLNQWCYIYKVVERPDVTSGYVVAYVPDAQCEADIPWYHPPVKSLAYLYENKGGDEAVLSIHFLPFPEQSTSLPRPPRLHRTFISLLCTFLRLAKTPAPQKHIVNGDHCHEQQINPANFSMAPSALKDTILPQHIVQDTYSRLKQQYAQDLISRWAEKTEPSKHVFEDLSIAAFVIELWRQMYPSPQVFPGFVDVACGNGVLTYVLIKEGYQGRGFDARRRNTWAVLEMDDHLDEMICMPKPFLDHIPADTRDLNPNGTKVHNGIFSAGTFIISNHADELTPWTPILAALSSPDSPLPFLAIPCCSHALSGAKHRYSLKDVEAATSYTTPTSNVIATRTEGKIVDGEEQPASGDLRAMRAAKVQAATQGDDKSMYACLTKKVIALAQELGYDVQVTLLRIPSTRNIGIVGNGRRPTASATATVAATAATRRGIGPEPPPRDFEEKVTTLSVSDDRMVRKVQNLVERECAVAGGVQEAAQVWIERARKLQTGRGRGKVNLGGKPGSGSAVAHG